MQLPTGIVRSTLLFILCLYIFIVPVCASAIIPLPAILHTISSSPVPDNATTLVSIPVPASPPITSLPITPVTDKNQRFAPLNPDFIAYQKNIASKTDAKLQKSLVSSDYTAHGLGFIPLLVDLSSTKGQDVTHYLRSNPLSLNFPNNGEQYPERFDLRTIAKVSPIQDQGNSGSCWAFASYASLESTLLPNEVWDFSENNMKNLLSSEYPDGFDRIASGGGNALMSTAYLARWTGPVREADDPYVETSNISPTDIPAVKHVQNVLFLPDRLNSTDNNNIKSALMTQGIVYTSMYWSSPYFNSNNDTYYYPLSSLQNHAIGIVGWDDNYSKENFTPVPPANGAFIIRNSWGNNWGDQGYFYVSYYDTYVGTNNAVFTAESVQDYDHIYQYDPLGWVTNFGNSDNSHTEWGANMFTSNSSETLSAVSFYTTDTDTEYDLYIYKNPDNGPLNTSGYSYREKGIINGPSGYYTKVISPGIILKTRDKFSVVINLTTKNNQYPLPIEYQWGGYSSQATANPGESFFSDDNGQTWLDMTDFDSTANICFKAFTIFTPPEAEFSANVFSGQAPFTVAFTDYSRGLTTAWYWSFGDGNSTDAAAQNPVHTYLSGGRYTVSLTSSNHGRSNTTIKLKYLNVTGGNDGLALFRNTTGFWYFDDNLDGIYDKSFRFGNNGDRTIRGDWQGTGADGLALFRTTTGFWYFDNNLDGIYDKSFRYGNPMDQILAGDWDGDGKDGIALFRSSTGYWYLDNNLDGIYDKSFRYGNPTDQILAGDWDGDLNQGIALFRSSTGYWYLDNNLDGIYDKSFRYGGITDKIFSYIKNF